MKQYSSSPQGRFVCLFVRVFVCVCEYSVCVWGGWMMVGGGDIMFMGWLTVAGAGGGDRFRLDVVTGRTWWSRRFLSRCTRLGLGGHWQKLERRGRTTKKKRRIITFCHSVSRSLPQLIKQYHIMSLHLKLQYKSVTWNQIILVRMEV